MPQIGLIADDFTGAMDSGAQFACSGLSVYFRITGQPAGDVEIINTASREIEQDEAVLRNLAACQLLTGRQLFKKIDSTLRGHVAAEIQAILAAGPYRKAVICPAAPLQGRTVLDGVVYVKGVPLAKTSFQNDPLYPARTSRVAELIKAQTAHLSLELVRSPLAQLIAVIADINLPLLTADAETSDDLLALARAIRATSSLPCGAFGLARAYLETLDVPRLEQPVFRPDGPVLVLVGSANQVAREQVRLLEAQPDCLALRLGESLDADTIAQIKDLLTPRLRVLSLYAAQEKTTRSAAWLRFGKTVSEIGLALIDRLRPATILVVGGETVTYFCNLAGAESIRVLGEVMPGTPFGRIQGGQLDGTILITQAGGFGTPTTLTNILYPGSEK